MQRIFLILLAIIVTVVGAWSYISLTSKTPPTFEQGLFYSQPRALADFELQSTTTAGSVDNSDLTGQWTILFTGYTFCPDICPTTMAQLKQRLPELQQATDTPLEIWMISVDPQRDDIERVTQYVNFFGEGFVGVTAEHVDLYPFVRNLGLMYSVPDPEETNYLVNHSAALILVNPDGHLQGIFRASHEPGRIPTVNPDTLVRDFSRAVRYLE